MTFRELFEFMRRHIEARPQDEALDREVVVRVSTHDGDEDLHVGGLRSAAVDYGHTDEPALTLDGDGSDFEDEDTLEERRPS